MASPRRLSAPVRARDATRAYSTNALPPSSPAVARASTRADSFESTLTRRCPNWQSSFRRPRTRARGDADARGRLDGGDEHVSSRVASITEARVVRARQRVRSIRVIFSHPTRKQHRGTSRLDGARAMFAARESYGCADGTSSVVARGASRAARRRWSTGIVPGRVPGHRSGGCASRVVAVDPSKLEGTPNKRGIVPGMGPGAREWRRIHKELKTKYKMRTVGSAECAPDDRDRTRCCSTCDSNRISSSGRCREV